MIQKDGSVKTIVKGREIIFYFTNEQDLKAIKSLGVQSNLFLGLSMLLFGGSISGVISISSTNFTQDGVKFLGLLNYFLLIIGLIFFVLFIVSAIKGSNTINEIIKSGEVNSFNKLVSNIKFEIISAKYGLGTEQDLDITEKISALVKKEQLTVTIPYNELAGNDPYPGKKKMLQIDYIYNGNQITKNFLEDQEFKIP